MSKDKNPPLLNPVLRLLTPNRPTPPTGGGKSKKDIDIDRLGYNIINLPKQIDRLKKSLTSQTSHAGKIIIHTVMHDDRLRPTLTPDDIFSSKSGQTKLITSTPDGYLVETSIDSLEFLKNDILSTTKINTRVDISSLKSINSFLPINIFTDGKEDEIWNTASIATLNQKKFKTFSIWLMPFISKESKKSVAKSFYKIAIKLVDDNISPTHYGDKRWISSAHGVNQIDTIQQKLKEYLSGDSPRIPLKLTSKAQLSAIIASGTVCRIDPVTQPHTSIQPGIGKEPSPPTPEIANSPIVAVVDGGLSARTYSVAVAWQPDDSFVPTRQADQKHGNQVASLVIDACGWNNQLDIPNSPCRIAPVQVVPTAHTGFPFDEEELLDYLDGLMASHPETKIWNFSFNQPIECKDNAVSTLGHGLSKLARKHKILPIISAGNKVQNQSTISPPADCEAAIVVSGRKHSITGFVDDKACDISRHGLGPYNTLRPDVSWFSTLRVIGGDCVTGTSYATPLVSRVAAHTYANLKHPSPDLVKAIILNNTDLDTHSYQLGWGSPIRTDSPWICPEGVVTLAWDSQLESGQEYHWHNIYVPPTMLKDGKIKGKILLTAVLNPRINDTGVGQYFLSRLETNIQCVNNTGEYAGIMPSCSTDGEIGIDGAKWNPTRVHRLTIPTGKACPDGKLRLRARVYLRDKFSLATTIGDERLGIMSDVSFALTFICADVDRAPETYNSFVQLMKNNVESAIIEQDIQLTI